MANTPANLGYFPERAERLERICSSLDIRQNFPLLKSGPLPARLYDGLCDAVSDYVLGTLSRFHDRNFASIDDWLVRYKNDIVNLPNITPNGLILPKMETCALYGRVHLAVADIVEHCGLAAHAEGFHVPINLRLVNGTSDPVVDQRPRASAKYHSDMWAGEPANAIMLFLPVFGDTENLGIHWIEPRSFPTDLMSPLDDFEQGRHLIDDGQEYDADFVNGEIVLSDPFLIHATQKRAPGLRLSIDFRLVAGQAVASDSGAPGTRRDSYMKFTNWCEIGYSKGLYTTAKLEPFTGVDEAIKNEYAHPFSVLDYDQRLNAEDIARMLAMPPALVRNSISDEAINGLRFRSATPEESQAITKRATELVEAPLPSTDDDGRLARWNDGWGEILTRVEREGVTEQSLMPGYFRHDTLRLNGKYIKVPDPAFEYRLHRIMARLLFTEYLAEFNNITELGCGTGANLQLLHELYPNARLVGADWALPSQELVSRIDDATQVIGTHLNLLTMDDVKDIPAGPGSAIFTMHALEQLGNKHSLLVDYLVQSRPGIVLHLEPIAELYDPANLFDELAIQYHNKRNYLGGYLSKLRELENAGKIELIKVQRTGFGSPFQEAYSIVVWRPL